MGTIECLLNSPRYGRGLFGVVKNRLEVTRYGRGSVWTADYLVGTNPLWWWVGLALLRIGWEQPVTVTGVLALGMPVEKLPALIEGWFFLSTSSWKITRCSSGIVDAVEEHPAMVEGWLNLLCICLRLTFSGACGLSLVSFFVQNTVRSENVFYIFPIASFYSSRNSLLVCVLSVCTLCVFTTAHFLDQFVCLAATLVAISCWDCSRESSVQNSSLVLFEFWI